MIELKRYRCKLCNHEWTPRVWGAKPMVCPRCKRYDWDDDKEVEDDGKIQ